MPKSYRIEVKDRCGINSHLVQESGKIFVSPCQKNVKKLSIKEVLEYEHFLASQGREVEIHSY